MNSNIRLSKVFDNFIKNPGAERYTILHACQTLKLNPLPDYLTVLQFTDGGEGFIRYSYFRLYSIAELVSLNDAYQVEKFAPGLVIFGSNGSGEAFGFDTREDPVQIVQLPFIPMDFEYAEPFGNDFMKFLSALEESKSDDDISLPQIDMSTVGKEFYERHPIVFGGSPTDEENWVPAPWKFMQG